MFVRKIGLLTVVVAVLLPALARGQELTVAIPKPRSHSGSIIEP
jgi:hypothetical protein